MVHPRALASTGHVCHHQQAGPIADSALDARRFFMFDHIGLRVKDLDASVRFYTAALGPLGYEAAAQDESSVAFGAKGTYTLWLYADAKLAHSLVHLASPRLTTRRSTRFTAPGSRRAAATTAHPGSARTTARTITPRSCSIPTGITSKRCA